MTNRGRERMGSMLTAVAVIVSAVFVAGEGLAANPHVILPDGRKIEGSEVRATREGQIILTTPEGRMTFDPGTQVVIDEPPEYARGLQQLQQRQYEPAIETLRGVIQQYRFLGWDQRAQRLLGRAYYDAGQFRQAVTAYDELFAAQPALAQDEVLQAGYLRALAAAGDKEKLLPLLEQSIRSGPRQAAAVAQVLRADVRRESGDIEGALFDYLRTSDLFRDAADVMGEATFKAAESFERLGDGAWAAVYYRRVAALAPDSTYAARAKVKAP